MKADLREVRDAPDRASAKAAIAVFKEKYGLKYPKAAECLTKVRETLLALFDFPAEHWDHLRTANPIESVFATVRHRTARTKGALSHKTARLMVFKLVTAASKIWRRLIGENRLPMVIAGVKFTDGVAVIRVTPINACQCRVNFPQKRRSKIPQFGRSACCGEGIDPRRSSAAARLYLDRRRNDGF